MKLGTSCRRVTRALGVMVAFAVAASMHGASAGDPASRYFSYDFGAEIDRIAAGADGRIYLAGWTSSTDLPASLSHPDLLPPRSVDYGAERGFLFVSALDASGEPLWTSYLPAGGGYYIDIGIGGLAAGSDGSVWLVGVQRIAPVAAFHTATPDTYDGFFAKFSADGEVLVASYLDDRTLDGTPSTWVEDVVVDASGDAYIAGSTRSPTLAGAPVADPEGTDGFLMRIRADGSDVVWTQRFGVYGNIGTVYCGGVALDAASGTVLVSYAGPERSMFVPPTTVLSPPEGFQRQRNFRRIYQAIGAARFDPDGKPIAGALLPFLPGPYGDSCGYGWGTRIPIAVDADGCVLVAGPGWIARLSSELEEAREVSFGVRSPLRIAPDGRGRVLVVDTYSQGQCRWQADDGYLAVLDHGLRPRPDAPFLRDARFARDLAIDPSGDLAFAGVWSGTPFNAPAEARPSTEWDRYNTITKVPLGGVRTPTRFRVRARDADTLDARWSADGDPVVRFELLDETDDGKRVLAGDIPASATSYRADGVTPGAGHTVSLVSVFANGVRSVKDRWAVTPPRPSANIVAARVDGLAVDVLWHDLNGRSTSYTVQRRVGSGPWIDLAGAQSDAPIGDPAALRDLVPDVADDVTYRVRASRRTRWATSAPIPPSASLRVTPTSGELRSWRYGGARFFLEGRFALMDGTPGAPFDPRSQELRLLYGDASAPTQFVIPAGDFGWTESGGVWTWSAAKTLNAWTLESEIVISPADGTFRVALESRTLAATLRSGAVAFNLGLGGLSGGDVRAWTVHSANFARYTLGPADVRAREWGR